MPEVGDIVTVILWSGELRFDAMRVCGQIARSEAGLASVRLVDQGDPARFRWFVVADAVRYQP